MTIQQADFAMEEEARLALESISEALYYFSQHHLQVEYCLFPFIVEYNPNLITGIKQQFRSNAVQIQRMRGVMNAYHHAVTTAEKELLANPFSKHLPLSWWITWTA
ncbi:hypothetical protein [Paraflavitalea speifideaquila]|uniref:hypothetical protein n=1 Tax=Paraflavitalea speifideaquila TaxID=3076558 RepID=UPI0028E98485|nr:hypothetical protein [Paraflavitalea speifideiaquila]